MGVRFMDPNETSRVREAINADAEFRLASRFFSKDVQFVVGDSKCIVKVRDGVVTEIKLNLTFMNPWSFFIKGSVETWEKLYHRPSLPTCMAVFPGKTSSLVAISRLRLPIIGQ